MGRHGRYGKYGEIKRIRRLGKGKKQQASSAIPGDSLIPSKAMYQGKKGKSEKSVKLRQAKPEDANFVKRLSETSFRRYGEYGRILPEWLDNDYALSVVAVMEGRPVGFAMVSHANREDYLPPISEVLAIAVLPEVRGRGVGGGLLGEVIERIQQEEARILILHVATDNLAAQALFRKYGFVQTQVKEGFYPKGQHALMMVLNLAEQTT